MPRPPLAVAPAASSDVEDRANDAPQGYARKISGVQRIALRGEDVAAARATRAAPEPTYSGPSADAKAVLVVDDDDAVRGLIARTLGSRYKVYEACDGIFAEELLNALDAAPAAMICDVSMPRLDGFALAKRVRGVERLKTMAIVFVTARTEALDIAAGADVGAKSYIAKPFKLGNLLDKIARAVR